eukprot:2234813-Amphidinium_carterae.3
MRFLKFGPLVQALPEGGGVRAVFNWRFNPCNTAHNKLLCTKLELVGSHNVLTFCQKYLTAHSSTPFLKVQSQWHRRNSRSAVLATQFFTTQ